MDPGDAEDVQIYDRDATFADESLRLRNGSNSPENDDRQEKLQYSAWSAGKDYHKIKWKRLSKNYNDQYLDIFRQNQQSVDTEEPLLISQIGSVTWTNLEKQRFFEALDRKGRHDVPAIAAAIGSKSETEVIQLLMNLRHADAHSQKFSRYAKNVTHAEIDAAIEVDEDLDTLLNNAADALNAFQDYYDLSAAKNKHDSIWLVDNRTAAYIRSKCDAREDADPEDDLGVEFTLEKGKNKALGMLKVDTMLELSKSIFMNTTPQSNLDHWVEVAEDDEQPSITVDAVQTYYGLIKSFLQKVLQSAIFFAESRIRSTSTPDYAAARLLKHADIIAALSVLGMPIDSFEHWARYPRRSGVRVVLGVHEKEGSDAEALSLQQIEDALSVRASKGRRRSLSSMVSMSSQDKDAEDEELTSDEYEPETSERTPHVRSEKRPERLSDRDTLRNPASSDDMPNDTTSHDSERSPTSSALSTDSVEDELAEVEETLAHVSRKRRRHMLEEAQDEFLEKLDRSAKAKEAARLRELLGLQDLTMDLKEIHGRRPRTMRRTVDELQDWSDIPYRSSWERKRSARDAFGTSSDEGM